VPIRRPDTVERVLARIESRVLQEVWFGRLRLIAVGVLAPVLAAAVTAWWFDLVAQLPPQLSLGVPAVTLVILMLAAGVSLLALAMRRFRWCCAAAYCCGLASAVGVGAFWWLQTGSGKALTWLVVADAAALLLAVVWLTLIVSPVQRSQPDMRGTWTRRDPLGTR